MDILKVRLDAMQEVYEWVTELKAETNRPTELDDLEAIAGALKAAIIVANSTSTLEAVVDRHYASASH